MGIVKTSVTLPREQVEWMKHNHINMSGLIRDLLDGHIRARTKGDRK